MHEVENTASDTIPPHCGLTAINAPGRYFWISCYFFFFNDYIEKSLETIHVMIGDAQRGRIFSDNSFLKSMKMKVHIGIQCLKMILLTNFEFAYQSLFFKTKLI